MKYFIPTSFLVLIIFTFFLKNRYKTPSPVIIHQNINYKLQSPKIIKLLLGGDVMLGRSVTIDSLDTEHDPTFPFTHISSLFEDSDLIFLNLENPITAMCPRKNDGMLFCAPEEMLTGLPSEKTIVNLANNHTLNYGKDGLSQTISYLDGRNINYTGVSKLYTKKIGETTFGFLGFDKDQQANPQLTAAEEQLVSESNKVVDVLFVALHWGVEYNAHPTLGQRKLAQKLVDLGADVLVGHHPHWVQDVEKIGNTPVYYSLGNLVFDQMWSEETRKGLTVRLSFEGKHLVEEELIPTYIKRIGQPIIMPSPNE